MAAEIVLPFAASLLDNILGFSSSQSVNSQNLKMNRENLQASKEMQQNQFQFQREMYEDAKLYNSPENQRHLYEEAGLNPYAMMSQSSFQPVQAMSGGSGSVPATHPVQAYQPNFEGAASAYFDSRIKQEQVENLRYQNDMKELTYSTELQDKIETILNKRVKTESDYTQLRILRQELSILEKSAKYKVSQNRADAERAQGEADKLDFDLFMSRILSPIYFGQQESNFRISLQQEKNLKAELYKIYAQIDLMVKQGTLNDAEADAVRQGIRIRTPDERSAEDITKLWDNKGTSKVEKFINRFNHWLDKVNPLRGLFGKGS